MKLFIFICIICSFRAEGDANDCFIRDIDIDGNFGRSNVVKDYKNIGNSDECQTKCENHVADGCKAFVWEEITHDCVLYENIKLIEYDYDEKKKIMGYPKDCINESRLLDWDFSGFKKKKTARYHSIKMATWILLPH